MWTSRPVASPEGATLWVVPSSADGLEVAAPFDGLGLRGSASSPIVAGDVSVRVTARQIQTASIRSGLMDVAHVATARFEHIDQKAEQPVVRQHIATRRQRRCCGALVAARTSVSSGTAATGGASALTAPTADALRGLLGRAVRGLPLLG